MQAPRNRSLWLGPMLALFGFLSYYTIFYRWPALRDFPWVNLILLVAAVAVSWTGLGRARVGGGWKLVAGVAGLAWSLLLTGLLCFYCFYYSYGLPSGEVALAVGAPVPNLTLPDQLGRDIDISDDQPTLLVFYRGHW